MLSFPEVAAVLVGGALGGAARYASLRAATSRGGRASLALVGVNLLGCVLGGAIAASVAEGVGRTFLIGGILGGFTTFSAVSLACAASPRGRPRRFAQVDAALTVLLAVPCARLGAVLASAAASFVAGGGG